METYFAWDKKPVPYFILLTLDFSKQQLTQKEKTYPSTA
jgi:hypothetical protein